MRKFLKWFSIFYIQRRKIILEKYKNRNTITIQMSKKDVLIHHTNDDGAGLSFNETQNAILNQLNQKN